MKTHDNLDAVQQDSPEGSMKGLLAVLNERFDMLEAKLEKLEAKLDSDHDDIGRQLRIYS